jgi:tRNA(Arg) A34 adenosine deaminase TadA
MQRSQVGFSEEEDTYFLERALELALEGYEQKQIPVGSVIVDSAGSIVASAHNRVRQMNDRTAHAELLAIREAMLSADGTAAPSWTLYVTLEPCPMCFSALVLCRIGRVVWAAPDPKLDTASLFAALPYPEKNNLQCTACPNPSLQDKSAALFERRRDFDE